jgi:glutamine amidotransferase
MIVIVDYGMGNVASVQKALSKLSFESIISRDPSDILNAAGLILPGVGSYSKAMANLHEFGLVSVLEEAVLQRKIKFLGICLGMQLLSTFGKEDGGSKGLDFIPGRVVHFKLQEYRVPHIGWSKVQFENKAIHADDFYFIHSYHFEAENPAHIYSKTWYEQEFVSGVQKENILGLQFHPEKSQTAGLNLINEYFKS